MARTLRRDPADRLIPPPGGAIVRMYRIGHGDCFLIAFSGGKDGQDPRYVLIDCGYKPGSSYTLGTNADQVVDNIRAATGGHIHVAVITHEHQDHVNGVNEKRFKGITIGECWLAWTEDEDDALANQLRAKYKDTLLGLIAAQERLSEIGKSSSLEKNFGLNILKQANKIGKLLEFDLGGEAEHFDLAAAAKQVRDGNPASNSANKKSMKVFKTKARAQRGVRYLTPHEKPLAIEGAGDLRVFVLGPPRDEELLESLDPEDGEGFHRVGFALSTPGAYFAAAAKSQAGQPKELLPFDARYRVEWSKALTSSADFPLFWYHYGHDGVALQFCPNEKPDKTCDSRPADEVWDNAAWRRIDEDWLRSAGQLALAMSNDTNNSSLVLAFELGRGGKVLLFAADAQRGNWLSWNRKDWADDHNRRITARDLLARTVLYKVGHHCSHNATLNGDLDDDYPNLSWMGQGEYAREFTAMITAVRAWAEKQNGWDHPLASIKEALLKKAGGRVLQTDTDLDTTSERIGTVDYKKYLERTKGSKLYFDHKIYID